MMIPKQCLLINGVLMLDMCDCPDTSHCIVVTFMPAIDTPPQNQSGGLTVSVRGCNEMTYPPFNELSTF